nr:hypothetical protein CFP56_69458 [Quercus suber]
MATSSDLEAQSARHAAPIDLRRPSNRLPDFPSNVRRGYKSAVSPPISIVQERNRSSQFGNRRRGPRTSTPRRLSWYVTKQDLIASRRYRTRESFSGPSDFHRPLETMRGRSSRDCGLRRVLSEMNPIKSDRGRCEDTLLRRELGNVPGGVLLQQASDRLRKRLVYNKNVHDSRDRFLCM